MLPCRQRIISVVSACTFLSVETICWWNNVSFQFNSSTRDDLNLLGDALIDAEAGAALSAKLISWVECWSRGLKLQHTALSARMCVSAVTMNERYQRLTDIRRISVCLCGRGSRSYNCALSSHTSQVLRSAKISRFKKAMCAVYPSWQEHRYYVILAGDLGVFLPARATHAASKWQCLLTTFTN